MARHALAVIGVLLCAIGFAWEPSQGLTGLDYLLCLSGGVVLGKATA